MSPGAPLDLVLSTILATVFGSVGILAFAAGVRWPSQRWPAILLAWAMTQHVVLVMTPPSIVRTLGEWQPLVGWTSLLVGYFVAVPWALLVEHVIGRGWKGTVRRTWQVYLVFAVCAAVFDVIVGRPGAAAGVSRMVIVAGVLVGMANISPRALRADCDVRPLYIGYLLFMGLVVHDTLAGLGLLPLPTTGVAGLVAFVVGLVMTVVSRALRTERSLAQLEQELETARRIQGAILPSGAPLVEGGRIAFQYTPAAAVAGDLFEFLVDGPRASGVLVADVSGHGVPAALIASMVKVAALAQRPHADRPDCVLAGIHAALAGELPPDRFVTAVYVYVDFERKLLRHASAGHPPALVFRAADGRIERAGPTGPLIISLAPPAYPVVEAPLDAGDRIVLYTDGVIECMRDDGEQFGPERLAAVVAAATDATALVSDVERALNAFRSPRGGPLEDDCTVLAIELDAVPGAAGVSPVGRPGVVGAIS